MAEAISHAARARPWLRPLTEAQMVKAAGAGDERALTQIYERFHQPLYRYCQSIVGSADDAQDALQNAMSKAFSALRGQRPPERLKPWLYRIAHNESIEVLRRRHDDAELTDAFEIGGASAGRQVEQREELRQLIADMRELPERHRAALLMRELAGLSGEEIAAALETSTGAAKQAIYEARVGLREISEGRDMECAEVQRSLSDNDGRVLGSRRIRSHLRSCPGCAGFKHAIKTRSEELHGLPVLPAVGAASILQGLLGGGHTGGGGGLLAAFGGLGSSATKVAAVSLITATVGVGAVAGVKHVTGNGGDRDSTVAVETGATQGPASNAEHRSAAADRAGQGAHGRKDDSAQARDRGRKGGDGERRAKPQAGGNPSSAGSATAEGAAGGSPGPPSTLPAASQNGQAQAEAQAPTLPSQATSHPQSAAHPTLPDVEPPTLPIDPPTGAGSHLPSGSGVGSHGPARVLAG